MKKIHGGSSEFAHVRTENIPFTWKFEDAEDHEHPFILTVTVAGQTQSEGCPSDPGEAEAAAKAEALAREIYGNTQA